MINLKNREISIFALFISVIIFSFNAHAELIFVQSFEKGLTPDYSLAAPKPVKVQGQLKTTVGWVTDAAIMGKNALQGVTYKIHSPFKGGKEGTVRFYYFTKNGRPKGDFFTLRGPGETLTLSASGNKLTATITLKGKTIIRNTSFKYAKKPERNGFVQVSWKPGIIAVVDTRLDIPSSIPFAFDSVTIGSLKGTPVNGALDEFAVYDQWQMPETGKREAWMLSWLSDKRVAKVARELGYNIRRAESKGLDVTYCKVAYHISRMAALRCRIKALSAARKKEMLDFVYLKCDEASKQVKRILLGRGDQLKVPNPDLSGLTVKNRALTTKGGEAVLLAQPMYGPDIASTKGITNNDRIYIYPNWTGANSSNTCAKEMNKGIYVTAFAVSDPSEKYPRFPNPKKYLAHFAKTVKMIDDGFARVPCPRAFAINFLNYESGGHFDYNPLSLSAFSTYLKKKYGNISNLNFTWGTKYASFSEALPPKWKKGDKKITPDNRAAWYDWLLFSTNANTKFYQKLRTIIKDKLKHLKVPINVVDCGQLMFPSSSGVACYDWDAMAKINDMTITEGFPRSPWTIQPFAIDPAITFQNDLQVSSQRPDQTVINMEHHCATPVSGRYATGNYYACALLREMLHGASAVGLWSGFHRGDIYRGKPVKGYFASIYQRAIKGKGLRGIYKYYKAILDCRRLAKEIVRFRSAPADTALLYSYTTNRQLPPYQIRDNGWSEHEKSFRRFYKAMNPLGDRIHILTDQQIADGKCGKFKLIIVPSVSHLSIPLVKKLGEYVRNGGTLVLAPGSLMYDEHHKYIPYRRKLFGLELTGWQISGGRRIPFAELSAKPDAIETIAKNYRAKSSKDKVISVPGGGLSKQVKLFTESGLMEIFKSKDSTTLLVNEQNLPVLGKVKYGKGSVYYITIPLEYASYLRILEKIRKDVGIKNVVRIENAQGEIPSGIEMRCVKSGNSLLLYVINLRESPIKDLRIKTDGNYSTFFELIRNKPMSDNFSLARLETKIIRIK